MTTEIAISENGVSFPSDTGEYRIPYDYFLDVPIYSGQELSDRLRSEAFKRGLMINIDFNIDTREYIVRWRPDVHDQ